MKEHNLGGVALLHDGDLDTIQSQTTARRQRTSVNGYPMFREGNKKRAKESCPPVKAVGKFRLGVP